MVLMPLLSDLYPYMTRDVYIQECYVRNVLQVTHYIPNLRQKICRLVVDGMLTFDVREHCFHIKFCYIWDRYMYIAKFEAKQNVILQ